MIFSCPWNFLSFEKTFTECLAMQLNFFQADPDKSDATTTGFLLTPTDLYQWCHKNISGIRFIWVSQEEIELHGQTVSE